MQEHDDLHWLICKNLAQLRGDRRRRRGRRRERKKTRRRTEGSKKREIAGNGECWRRRNRGKKKRTRRC